MRSDRFPGDACACGGCSLCRTVCPLWRTRRDPRASPDGLVRARRGGASPDQLAAIAFACELCGACDAACPEAIDLTGMVLDLRRAAPRPAPARAAAPAAQPEGALLLPGAALRADAALLTKVRGLLNIAVAADDGDDLVRALEAGAALDRARRRLVDGLEGRTLVVGDGLLLRLLRQWLPGARLQGLGEALSLLPGLRRRIASADFYVVEARAYHAERERLVAHYDGLRRATGCAMNLDLQRIAVPAADEQAARWLLRGRAPQRIVVENPAEREPLRRVAGVPVLHLAELAA